MRTSYVNRSNHTILSEKFYLHAVDIKAQEKFLGEVFAVRELEFIIHGANLVGAITSKLHLISL